MSEDIRLTEEQSTLRRARLLGLNYIDTSQPGPKPIFKDFMPNEELYSLKIIPLEVSQNKVVFGITTTTSQQTMNALTQRFMDQRVSYVLISDTGFRDYMKLYDPPKQVVYQDISINGTAGTQDSLIEQVSATLDQVRADDMLAYLTDQADVMVDLDPDDPHPIVRLLNRLLGDIERLEITVTELLQLARTADRPAAIELGPVLAELESAWRSRVAAHGRHLFVESGRYAPQVLGHTTMLRHALDVLVDNAVVHGRGDISVALSHDDHTVVITVNDEGAGMPIVASAAPDQHVSAPGAGQGLALAHRLVAAQHGRVDLLPPPGGHVAVRLRRVDPGSTTRS